MNFEKKINELHKLTDNKDTPQTEILKSEE